MANALSPQAEASRARTLQNQRVRDEFLHDTVDQTRKDAACASLLTFKQTYFPERYNLPFSPDHLTVNARTEEAVCHGGKFALAMSRGSGKTTDAEIACLWATLTGRHKVIVLIGSSEKHSTQMLEAIKQELLTNDLLDEDFNEVTGPLRDLGDRANRAKGQHIDGLKLRSAWGPAVVTYPTWEKTADMGSDGATIIVTGITGRVRGLKKGNVRPSLVIIDDAQTDESAGSVSQCDKLARVISGAILGMAGPGKKITVLFLCTVIRKGDLAEHFLDRDKSPEWTGQRFKLLYEFPTNIDLWDEYSVKRSDSFKNDGNGAEATAFYEANREAMDAGAVVAWPERFKPDEISGLQHAMNLYYADKYSFFAEYQNNPLDEDLGGTQLEKDKILARTNGLARGIIPANCTRLTAFADVQQKVLFWLVAAWSDDFTGSVVDYGSWPDQNRRYFTSGDVQRTLARATPNAGLEAQITAALTALAEQLLSRSFEREDGASLKIEKFLIDAGFQGDTVKAWARSSPYAALVMPSHGHGFTASSKPWSEYDRNRCERLGTHWLIPKLAPGKKAFRHCQIDTNWWKDFVSARLLTAVGDKGALTLFGRPGQDHGMLGDHLTAEYWIATEGRGRKLHEWKLRPGMSENHYWDALVGCTVAASMQGCVLIGAKEGPRKVVSYSQLYRQARERDAQKPEKSGERKTVSYSEMYRQAREK